MRNGVNDGESTSVPILLKECDALFVAETEERLRNLRRVRVSIRGRTDLRCGGGQVGLHIDPESFTVTKIESRTLASLTGRIDCGFVLVSINGAPATEESIWMLQGHLSPNDDLHLEFCGLRRPYHSTESRGRESTNP